jgi:superfamily II DNA helicase RecQ
MGVNVPVKSVIHWELPFNMESYVQAIGRAGRDGSIASCALFWNKWDVESLKRRVRSGGGAMNRRAKNALEVEKYCQLKTCRNLFIVNYFASVEDVWYATAATIVHVVRVPWEDEGMDIQA